MHGRRVGGRLRLGVPARGRGRIPWGRPHLTITPPRRRCPVAGARPVGRRAAAKGAGWRCPTPPRHRRAASGSSSAGRATATPGAGTSRHPRDSARRQRRPESERAPGTAEPGRPSSTSRSRQREIRTAPRPSRAMGSRLAAVGSWGCAFARTILWSRVGWRLHPPPLVLCGSIPPSLTTRMVFRHSTRPRPSIRRRCVFAPRGLSREGRVGSVVRGSPSARRPDLPPCSRISVGPLRAPELDSAASAPTLRAGPIRAPCGWAERRSTPQ